MAGYGSLAEPVPRDGQSYGRRPIIKTQGQFDRADPRRVKAVQIIVLTAFGLQQLVKFFDLASERKAQGVVDRTLANAVRRCDRADAIRLEFEDQRRAFVVDTAKALDLQSFEKPMDDGRWRRWSGRRAGCRRRSGQQLGLWTVRKLLQGPAQGHRAVRLYPVRHWPKP